MVCKVENCNKKVVAKGLCSAHYTRLRRHNDISYKEEKEKHGQYGTSTYKAWTSMKYRCLTPTCHAYKSYGGRGITVCDRWMKFENFYKDMGEKPGKDFELDRIDNNGNYEPCNCRWTDRKTNGRNRGVCKLTKAKAEKAKELMDSGMSPSKVADLFGVAYTTMTAVKQGRTWI